MIIEGIQGDFHEVTLVYLTPIDTHDLPRYFSTSEQLIAYLKNRPDKHFSLRSIIQGATLSDISEINAYGPKLGDVLCGQNVFYSSKDGVVFTEGRGRDWSG